MVLDFQGIYFVPFPFPIGFMLFPSRSSSEVKGRIPDASYKGS